MSLQWNLVAGFLYFEIAAAIFLMLPILSPQRWQKIFRSRFLNFIRSYANLYFNIFIVILIILFADSIRDMRKYSGPMEGSPNLENNPNAEAVVHMKLFRAQRNFYIAGFSLFLFFVLRKLVTNISTQAQLMATAEASRKQAESATAAAQGLLDSQDKKAEDEGKDNAANDRQMYMEELAKTKKVLAETKDVLEKKTADLEAMKKQTEGLHREYDRLSEEMVKLQNAQVGSGDKKGD